MMPMDGSTHLEAKFVGSMVGSALGDAIGEMAFRHREETSLRSAVERSEKLVYTDDTAMSIGLAESLIAVQGLDQEHLGDTFRANYRREPWRGYASGPPTVFSKVEREGISYQEAARTLYGGEGSYGNGAAMRVAPLGLFFYDAPGSCMKARASATVTHVHPVGVDGAAVQAQAVAEAVMLDPELPLSVEPFLRTLLETARTVEMEERLMRVGEVVRTECSPRAAIRRLGQGVAVHESLPFAIYAFLRNWDDFEACLFCASLHGGDRDTLGAMACAISGAFLGVDGIPEPWRRKLEDGEYIAGLARQLVAARSGREGGG